MCVSDVKLCKFLVIDVVSNYFSDLYTEQLETAVQNLTVFFNACDTLHVTHTASIDVLTVFV